MSDRQRKPSKERHMVTIIPIEIDEDVVREGITLAVAARVEAACKQLQQLVAELRAGGLIAREQWQAAIAGLREEMERSEPLLEYGRGFEDQWPELAEGGDDDNA